MKKISIHALREEGDVLFDFLQMMPIPISIHALREEGDGSVHLRGLRHRYFYPRPPRGGRLPKEPPKSLNCIISIHALREEGDINARKNCGCTACISIHALREEGDRIFSNLSPATVQFLSTPSARRATLYEREC